MRPSTIAIFIFILNYNKKLRLDSGAFDALYTLDLSGTKATGANRNGGMSTVNDCLYLTDIRLPGSVGLTVRVGYVVTKSHALTADAALSHFDTSKIGPRGPKFI